MINNKSVNLVWVFLPLLFPSIIDAQTNLETPSELVPHAEQCLSEFLNNADRDYLAQFGWWHPDDIPENFRLGNPYPIYLLDLNLLSSNTDVKEFKNSLSLVLWSIPVSYLDEPRLLIKIEMIDGEWLCIEYGRDPNPILNARSKWPSSDGYTHYYVETIGGPDFITIENGSELSFYPFNKRNEHYLNINKDSNGHYPVLTFDGMMKKLVLLVDEGKVPEQNDIEK